MVSWLIYANYCPQYNLAGKSNVTFSSEINRRQGGLREKVTEFLLRGRMLFCYHVNRFLTVCLLSEIFNLNKLSQKMQFLTQTSPPPHDAQCRFLLEVKQMPQ